MAPKLAIAPKYVMLILRENVLSISLSFLMNGALQRLDDDDDVSLLGLAESWRARRNPKEI